MTKRLVELNNKSRKGLYLYLKEPGERGKYYKYKKGIEQTIAYQKSKTLQKKGKKVTPIKPTTTKIRRRRTIETTLKKGIKTVKITQLNTSELHRAKRRLFKNIIKDNELLELLISEHNLQKIKHRFDITVTAKGQKGVLFTAEKLNITPDKALTEAKEITTGMHTRTYGTDPLAQNMQRKGWTINSQQSGKITNVTMTITFRKN